MLRPCKVAGIELSHPKKRSYMCCRCQSWMGGAFGAKIPLGASDTGHWTHKIWNVPCWILSVFISNYITGPKAFVDPKAFVQLIQ